MSTLFAPLLPKQGSNAIQVIDLCMFALQHVVIVITWCLLNSPLLFMSFFELISCNDDHHAHGLLGVCKHVCVLD